jgi:hypothetical protein
MAPLRLLPVVEQPLDGFGEGTGLVWQYLLAANRASLAALRGTSVRRIGTRPRDGT